MEFSLSSNGACMRVCVCGKMDHFWVEEKERKNHSSLITFFFFIGHLLSPWQTIVLRSLYTHKIDLSLSVYSSSLFYFLVVHSSACFLSLSLFVLGVSFVIHILYLFFAMSLHVCWLLFLLYYEIDVAWCDAFHFF